MSNSSLGILYVIGVGPGDPELLTLKAAKVLKRVPVLCVPKGREDGRSLALSIISSIVDVQSKKIIEAYFPMVKTRNQGKGDRNQGSERKKDDISVHSELESKWTVTISRLKTDLAQGLDVAFITLGDPTIYSTFYYLYEKLMQSMSELRITVIPGISSINASAAAAGIPLSLADEKIAVLPATYEDDIRTVLHEFDTVILMKVHRVFQRMRTLLNEMGILDRAVYVCRAGMEDEKIFPDIRKVGPDDLNYFSTMILKK